MPSSTSPLPLERGPRTLPLRARFFARDSTSPADAFVSAFTALASFKLESKFSTWLFTIARNLCLNEIRRRSRHPAESLDAVRPDSEDEPMRQYEDIRTFSASERMLQNELTEKIQKALEELPENQRTAILLFREQDLSYEEISEVLKCSLSATKSLMHRGRETLKQKLKPYLRSGAWQEPTT
jgi:RNA polymerase sigma-70 factor (ECF subfamily)